MRARFVNTSLNESDYPITFGQHRGKTYDELPSGYKEWLDKQPGFSIKHEMYKRNKERIGLTNEDEDWVFRTGKYKGQLFSEVSVKDPEYREFVLKHGIEKFKDFGDDGRSKPIEGDFEIAKGVYKGKLLSEIPAAKRDWMIKNGGKRSFGVKDMNLNRGNLYFLQDK